ncbi:MAG: methylmalonyl Co-A mutase-associated GTPase MeaB [Chloroflexi bacterium]|nr:methylmalonyl Co-A mutase-associated GTPase MeaB [Chloroflexota bacterium]
MSLVERIQAGDRLALARLLTQIENEDASGFDTLTELFPRTGRAHLIGITGAPGSGKSTLVNRLALELRHRTGATVAVVAVDPSSPFTGGALLGDRIRMRDLSGDPGVFIRSMASRGALGGLARTTAAVVDAFDAAGYGWVLIETVGAGQAEVEIARTAHTTVVIEAPGAGDDVQAIKAGILEAADVLVVNKADLPGADNAVRALQSALELAANLRPVWDHHGRLETVEATSPEPAWTPPVLKAVATQGGGIVELVDAIQAHGAHLKAGGGRQRRDRERLRSEVLALLGAHLLDAFLESRGQGPFDAAVESVVRRRSSPRQAVEALLQARR